MPNPGRTGDEEKIILNGGVTARILDETCKTIYSFTEHSHFNPVLARQLVVMANKLEDDANNFRRHVLEAVGFEGPWPYSLTEQDPQNHS